MSEHEGFAQWSAAYVLGALDAEDRGQFERHLGSCQRCQDEVRQFAPLPGLLARVDSLEEAEVPERVLEGALGSARSDQQHLLDSRNSWRLTALVSAAAAIVLLLLGLPDLTEPEMTVVRLHSEMSVSGEIGLEAKAWGTAVTLELEGLPHSDIYIAWAIDHEGGWQQIAAWGPVRGPKVAVEGASSWQVSDLSTIVVTTDDPAEILASGETDT